MQEKLEGHQSRFYAESPRGCSVHTLQNWPAGAIAVVNKMGKQEVNTQLMAPERHHFSCHLGIRKLFPP